MPTVTHDKYGTLKTYSAEETRTSTRLHQEVAERLGYNHEEQEADTSVSIQSVSHVVGWAHAYAPASKPFNEKNPLWSRFSTLCDWFKSLIITELSLPIDTDWEIIYRQSGFLADEEYESEEKFLEAWYKGQMIRLRHPDARKKLDELEDIKYQNDGLV